MAEDIHFAPTASHRGDPLSGKLDTGESVAISEEKRKWFISIFQHTHANHIMFTKLAKLKVPLHQETPLAYWETGHRWLLKLYSPLKWSLDFGYVRMAIHKLNIQIIKISRSIVFFSTLLA